MAVLINTEKLRLWLLGDYVAVEWASFFNTLEKDDVISNGIYQSKYNDLTRDELSLIALTQYKRYLEYAFPLILGFLTRWNVCVGQQKDVSRGLSCYIWWSQLAFTCSKSTMETPEQCVKYVQC